MNIDWTLAGAVMLSGLSIVFAALVILIIVVYLMGKITGQTKPKPKAPTEAPKAAPAPAAASSSPAPVVQAGIEEETVAVISAAVACMMAETAPGSAYAVTSISRGRESRPVWGFAGMQQNTRPF